MTDTGKSRIAAIDIARGFALLTMAIYHFAWDLEFFGYADPGMTAQGGWRLFARGIASSFLFLVGVSLYLGHGKGIRWRGFWRRFAMIVAAALAITAATYVAVPDAFIFFGILHHIAVASLLGLAFLRLPVVLVIAAAVLVAALPFFARMPAFDHPALWWLGLAPTNPRSNDYVPLFPWFAAVLAGMAAARLASASGLLARLARWHPGGWARPFILAGNHSLLVYLVHQPILIGLIWFFAQLVPPAPPDLAQSFVPSCQAQCAEARGEAFCAVYCVCMLDRLEADGMLADAFEAEPPPETQARLQEAVAQCSVEADRLEEQRATE